MAAAEAEAAADSVGARLRAQLGEIKRIPVLFGHDLCMGRAQRLETATGVEMRQRQTEFVLPLPLTLRGALASTTYGRARQGLALDLPSRAQLHAATTPLVAAIHKTHAALPVTVLNCSSSTDVGLVGALLQTCLGVEFDERDPQGFVLEDPQPQVVLLAGADLLSNACWQVMLGVMKKCAREDWPLLVVSTSVDTGGLLARLYGLDNDSSMMWGRDSLETAAP